MDIDDFWSAMFILMAPVMPKVALVVCFGFLAFSGNLSWSVLISLLPRKPVAKAAVLVNTTLPISVGSLNQLGIAYGVGNRSERLST